MQLNQSPQDYVDDMERLPGGTAVAQTPTPTGVTPVASSPSQGGFVSALANLIPAGLTAVQQINLQNLQRDLIRQGRPPLTAAQIQAMSPQLNIGVSSGVQNMLLYGGAALVGLLVLSQLTKRR